jgi:alpha-L-fucosidase
MYYQTLLFLGTAVAAAAAAAPPIPTAAQLRLMRDVGLAQFMHFSVNPWSSIEHNCVGDSPECIPAAVFNPTNLSTDQWVETAVAFGAKEICLTAHHEGGFALWDTAFTNYSVMHSPYGRDVVAQFVQSCKRYGIKPCYYMGPNANGWLSNHKKVSASEFVRRQLGMLEELLTKYELPPSRLWWDHYPSGCGGLAPCPNGSFPAAWPQFVELVRAKSPATIICPGPDCDGHQGESGLATYPSWFPCDPQPDPDHPGVELKCGDHAPNASLTGFHPYEACATMHNGWFCKGDGSDLKTNTYWSAGEIWDHYMNSVGVGWVNTLNAPPGTTGQIPQPLVTEMTTFGSALRALLEPVVPALSDVVGTTCQNTTIATIKLDDDDDAFNAIISREDLSHGQRIVSYALDFSTDFGATWRQFQFSTKHGASVGAQMIDFVSPPPPSGVRQVRFRCIASMAEPVYLASFSLHAGARPSSGI